MHRPTISVVMTVYNGEQFVATAIESILNQTYQDFEFIIVNDCCTDSTPEIVSRYDDDRIVLLNNETNIHLVESLNKGIQAARGEFIARMDADDISAHERFERQLAWFDGDKRLDLVSCWYSVIDLNGEEVCKLAGPCEDHQIREQIFNLKVNFCHGSVMIRKAALDRVGLYDLSLSRVPVEDYDLWLRLAESGSEFAIIPEYLYALRVSPDSITGSIGGADSQRTVLKAVIRKARLEALPLDQLLAQVPTGPTVAKLSPRRREAYYYRIVGARKVDAKNLGGGRHDLLKAIARNPGLVGAWYYLVLSMVPEGVRRIVKRVVASAKAGRVTRSAADVDRKVQTTQGG